MRGIHVRGQEEIRKRMLVHTAAFNVGLLVRKRFGFGTPRSLQRPAAAALADAAAHGLATDFGQIRRILGLLGPSRRLPPPLTPLLAQQHHVPAVLPAYTTGPSWGTSSTDCY